MEKTINKAVNQLFVNFWSSDGMETHSQIGYIPAC